MKSNWIGNHWWLPVVFAGTGLSSFALFDMQDNFSINPPEKKFNVFYAQLKDTVPPEQKDDDDDIEFKFKTGDIDKAIADMERELQKATGEFKNRDWKKIDEERNRAMQEMKKVDFEKIKKEMHEAFNSVEWEKIQKEIASSLRQLEEVRLHRLRKELEENLPKQLAEAERQFEKNKKAQELQSEKLNENIGRSLEETMKNLDKSLARAKEQLKELKKMTLEMEKDGLIKKGENATIKYKNGELFINGKKQSKEVTDKYKHYFKKGNVYINIEDKDEDDWI